MLSGRPKFSNQVSRPAVMGGWMGVLMAKPVSRAAAARPRERQLGPAERARIVENYGSGLLEHFDIDRKGRLCVHQEWRWQPPVLVMSGRHSAKTNMIVASSLLIGSSRTV